jgi:hypothetical protein
MVAARASLTGDISLEMTGPHLSGPPIDLDPQEASARPRLERTRVSADDLVPSVRSQGGVVVGLTREETGTTDGGRDRA